MLKKLFLLSFLLTFAFLASGCGTIYKGAQGMKEGAKEDWSWLAKHADNADDWIKTNLW
ncbi:MAG: hypothetical protein PHE30_04155 [Candidatus Omnitrophica bacterium]|nr:hypothetical protein [Candidatus Omnitrophota bacterium]MDD5027280.1 hypothetical protein [Candidatus Omnitrophota bacterium]MDD5661543.1 hypothetical protein [Candidatus Omnitrophota bacterium]